MATPKIIPYQVKLRSTTIERSLVRPIVYTNDLRSAEFQFQVTDMQAGELSGATATTLLYMRDGSFFQNPKEDVELTGTTFSYLLKEDEGNHAGIARIQLVVRFNEGLEDEQNFPSQLYDFEIVNGLETQVAQQIMIHDWTTLTREARAYIDEFAANEILREAEFDNNEFDRNAAFNLAQTNRQNQFSDLAEDLTATLAAADANIEEFDVALETGIAAAKLAEKLEDFEEINNSRLLSTERQLAHIESTKADLSDLPSSAYVFKGSTTFAALPTTGNTLGDVRWTTDNLLNYAWTGTAWTPIGNGAFADGSVVTPKLADKATTIPKLNLETQHAILSKKLFNELEILPIEPKLGLFYQGNYSTASKYAAVIDKFSVSADHILKFSKKYNFILRKFTTDTTNTAVFMSGSELLIPTNPVDILYYSLEIYKYGDAWGTTYTQALVDEVKANFMIFKFSPKIKKRLVPNTISGLIDDGTNGNPQGTYTAATGWGVYDVTLEKGEMIYYDMWVLKGAQSLSKFNVDGTFKESIITTSAVVNTNIKGVYVATEEIEHLKFNHVFTTYPFKCYKIQPDDLKSPLFGKTINFIGDSYVANNTESIDKTWHYKLADKHQMTYNNYGINGNGIVGIRGGTTPMKDRFTAMANNADYIVVIGGENDANLLLDIEEFKTGLDSFIAGLVAKYPKGKICFFTPWNAAWSTRNYIQPYIDAMIERCDHWCVPIFDASKNAGLYSWAGPSYRGFFFQGAYDGAHLNEAGHNNFLTAGEAFLENL